MSQTKMLIARKRRLRLKPRQESIVIGSLLGDGTMRVGHDAKNANFKIEHGAKFRDYVLWKWRAFKKWAPSGIQQRFVSLEGEKVTKSWWFRTFRHPILTQIHKQFYRNGKKIVPLNISEMLSPRSLATWYMDDGNLNGGKTSSISTHAFDPKDIQLLIEALDQNFGLRAKAYQDGGRGLRMYFNNTESRKLHKIIRPFMPPIMRYKVASQ